ncbi:MAG: hypothetical protein L6Q97_01855 [Thermoanaerobaculia bacterium]|nr:hypothetical protein [Thermoanaerobaculia bacterium]
MQDCCFDVKILSILSENYSRRIAATESSFAAFMAGQAPKIMPTSTAMTEIVKKVFLV